MKDTIYRSDAIETVQKIVPVETEIDSTLLDKAEVIVELSALPSAEAVEVVRDTEWVAVRRDEYEDFLASAEAVQGEWKRVETRTYKGECTNCGFRHIFMDGHDSQYRFCPYCGARMKGGDSE